MAYEGKEQSFSDTTSCSQHISEWKSWALRISECPKLIQTRRYAARRRTAVRHRIDRSFFVDGDVIRATSIDFSRVMNMFSVLLRVASKDARVFFVPASQPRLRACKLRISEDVFMAFGNDIVKFSNSRYP
jgi:hypothetical protein